MLPLLGAAIGPAIGLLGGIFGKKSDKTLNQYNSQAAGAYGKAANIGTQIGSTGAQEMGGFENYDPQYQGAVNDRLDYLKQDPFTSTRDTADLATATSGLDHDYNAGTANLSAEMARRGLDTGDGGQNSMMAGGITSLLAGRAQAQAQARNGLAYNRIATRNANQKEAIGLTGQAADTYFGRGMNAMGQDASIQQGVANGYGNMAGAAQAQNNYENGQMTNLMGSSGSALGYILGRGKTPMPMGYNYGFNNGGGV